MYLLLRGITEFRLQTYKCEERVKTLAPFLAVKLPHWLLQIDFHNETVDHLL